MNGNHSILQGQGASPAYWSVGFRPVQEPWQWDTDVNPSKRSRHHVLLELTAFPVLYSRDEEWPITQTLVHNYCLWNQLDGLLVSVVELSSLFACEQGTVPKGSSTQTYETPASTRLVQRQPFSTHRRNGPSEILPTLSNLKCNKLNSQNYLPQYSRLVGSLYVRDSLQTHSRSGFVSDLDDWRSKRHTCPRFPVQTS